jgi:hypothetical protein
MDKTPNIFVLTVIYLERDGSMRRHRCWGWFPTLALAEETIERNYTDIYEMGYYNTVVVEEMPWGPLAIATDEHWYSVTYAEQGDAERPDKYDIKKIDKSESLLNMVSFGMG